MLLTLCKINNGTFKESIRFGIAIFNASEYYYRDKNNNEACFVTLKCGKGGNDK